MQTTYPGRLYHAIPGWVKDGSIFHIRIRCDNMNAVLLSAPPIAASLLESVCTYSESQRWHAHLFLLMPDHLHALLSFPREARMSSTIGDWKRFQARNCGIRWQTNFFDHRIRSDKSFVEKAVYIRRNPVVKGLCARAEDWPWYFSAAEGGR